MIRAAVLGGDVSKSRSPAIHRAGFRALGIQGRYQAFSVDARGFPALARRLAAEGFAYLNVTIPHKRLAAALADRPSRLVTATGAANTLILERGRGPRARIRAENTDGYGLLAALRDLGVPVGRGRRLVLVGSGGAAAGALAALLEAGARVAVVARRPAAARGLGRRLPSGQRERIEIVPWSPPALAAALRGAAALVSAVPAAAWNDEEARAGLAGLGRRAAVLEMAYQAQPTPLARAARALGARYQDGIPMLVHQAARAMEIALGRLPPAAPLMRAARRA